MNTTPIQFGHITITGQKYPVKFGTAMTRDYCKALNCEIKDFNALFKAEPLLDDKGKPVLDENKKPVVTNRIMRMETNGEELITLLWAALKQGARVEGEAFKLTLDDAADLIDRMKPEQWSELFTIMNDGVKEEEEQASPNGKNLKVAAA